jgi:hypothetical protein
MPQASDTALLILDFQVGIGDRPMRRVLRNAPLPR